MKEKINKIKKTLEDNSKSNDPKPIYAPYMDDTNQIAGSKIVKKDSSYKTTRCIEGKTNTFNWDSGNSSYPISYVIVSAYIEITSPENEDQFTDISPIPVSFTMTTSTPMKYITGVALFIDNALYEKRTPYSASDFTITAGDLAVGTYDLKLKLYDHNDNVTQESSVVEIEIVSQ